MFRDDLCICERCKQSRVNFRILAGQSTGASSSILISLLSIKTENLMMSLPNAIVSVCF